MRFENYRAYSSENLERPFVTSGSKVYMVGRQDGGFIQAGEHIPKEMHGVWNHPDKWLDGFWFYVDGKALTDWAVGFESLPYGSGHDYILPDRTKVSRRQFCPDTLAGMHLSVTFDNPSSEDRLYTLTWVVRSDLVPVWDFDWGTEVYTKDQAVYDSKLGGYVFSDDSRNVYVAAAGDRMPVIRENAAFFTAEDQTPGKGTSIRLGYSIKVPAKDSCKMNFVIAGSRENQEQAVARAETLRDKSSGYLHEKIQRCRGIFEQSQLSLPDKKLEQVYHWTKWHLAWLIRDVAGYGQGLGAGLPEYPWWFGCDNYYALQGALAVGFHDLAKKTLNLLRDYSVSHNGNGRVVHEVTTEGKVINPGNTQETANYIVSVYRTFQYTGDKDFLEAHFEYMKKGIDWLYQVMDPDEDMLPSGYGITEIEGLNVELIDTAVYSCEALMVMAEAAELLEDPLAEKYRTMAGTGRRIINQELFMEDLDLYADAMATPAMILSRIDKMITRMYELEGVPEAGLALTEMKKDFETMLPDREIPVSIFKNWAINTPMETGIADEALALRALKAMDNETFIGPHGIYLSGLMRTHMMTISTGVQAVAEARYGRFHQAIARMHQIADTFSALMPGSITEMSPNYGCYVQAWTIYGIALPLIRHFFGVMPDAYHRRVQLHPNMPANWVEASLSDMKIGDTTLIIKVTEKAYEITIDPTWQVEVVLKPEDKRKIIINNTQPPTTGDNNA